MYHVPPKIVVHGDENKAAHYMGPAREFLRRLVHSMSFQDLKQLEDSKTFSDGTVIHVVHRFGESVISIYCPYDVPEEEEKEEVIEEGTERKAHFFIKFIAYRPEDDSGYTVQDLVLVRHITFDENWSLQGNVLTGPGYWTRGIRVGDRLGDSSDSVITGVSDNSLTFEGDPLEELIVHVTISIYRLVDRVIQPDEEEGKEREFGAAWVWFDRDQVYGTQTRVFFPGDQWEEDVAAPVPPDAVENVGAWHHELIQKIAGTLTTENFGGKAFELSYDDVDGNSQTNRYASYTGNVPLLFREGELIHKSAPNIDIYQDPGDPLSRATIYMANMHKMILQNGKHVAWYYYKQNPYFVESIRGEADMRFTTCTMDLVTVVGDEMEIAVPTPRAVMRGSSSRATRDAATENIEDSSGGTKAVGAWLYQWASPWAGPYEPLQFPQSLHIFFDIQDIDSKTYADSGSVTLTICSNDALVEATYSLSPDDKGDIGFFASYGSGGYSYGGYQEKLSEVVVSEAESMIFTSAGWGKYPGLEYEFILNGNQKYPVFSHGVDKRGEYMPTYGIIFVDGCSRMTQHRRYGGIQGNTAVLNPITLQQGTGIYYTGGIQFPYRGVQGIYSMGFFMKGLGTGRALEVFKKYVGSGTPFQMERLQRYYRHGNFSAGSIRVGDARVWGEPIFNYVMCGSGQTIPRYRTFGPHSIHWNYAEGSYRHVKDHNLFNFLWHEMYNDPWNTGCKMFCSNIIQEKGRFKHSNDDSYSFYDSQRTNINMPEIPVGQPPYAPSKSTCESWYTLPGDIPFTLEGHDSGGWEGFDWSQVDGAWFGSTSYERRDSYWSKSDSLDEQRVWCSDGEAAFTLPADAWEYYFMDDRSVDDGPQGVFLACKTATTWRFFHFWEGAGTIKEVTNEIWAGLGFTTPQQRVSIQCIGVI